MMLNTSAYNLPSLAPLFLGLIILMPVVLLNFESEYRQKLRRILAGLFVAIVCTGVLFAQDLFIDCNWDSLVDTYGYAMAWVMWTMGQCY